MADKKSKNTRVMALLMLLLVATLFFIFPIQGKTGWDHTSAWLGLGQSAPKTKTPVMKGGTTTRVVVQDDGPAVDDSARNATPVHTHTRSDQAALDRLVEKARK